MIGAIKEFFGKMFSSNSKNENHADEKTLHLKLLDNRITALKDATSRSRSTWLFAILLSSVFAVVIFNERYSYTQHQLMRRAQLVHAVSKNQSDIEKIINNKSPSSNSPTKEKKVAEAPVHKKEEKLEAYDKEADEFLYNLYSADSANLLHITQIFSANNTNETLVQLRNIAKLELQEYAKRQIAFDALAIPLIGVSIASGDLGIVGGTALIVVGLWFTASLRREYHAFFPFILPTSGDHELNLENYTKIELAYAYHSICQYMVFTISKSGSPINLLTAISFAIPPALMISNHAKKCS